MLEPQGTAKDSGLMGSLAQWALPSPSASPVGPLATAFLLSLFLHPASLLTQEHRAVEPIPSLKMKFDPRRMTLTWDCQENATYVECVMFHKEKGPITIMLTDKECRCKFPDSSLHGGVTLMVTANISQRLISEKLVYPNPGEEGTAAQNFSCSIYNAYFMNCTWAKGQAAPDDVQYFLYIRDSRRKIERECPHYVEDLKIHVGCHLKDLSGLTFHNYFLVNGTSQRTRIQFFDSILSLKAIERYSPPHNVTVHCNGSHCLIRWEKPRTLQSLTGWEFQYQLDIQRQSTTQHSGNQLIEVSGDAENKYNFPSPQPRGKHAVRVRTSDSRIQQWSAWSRPVEFGSEETEASLVHVYVLVVLGTLACALLLGCLLKRVIGKYKLFPPIPRIKDKLTDNHQSDQQMIWEKFPPSAGRGDNEEVLTVEEVTEAPTSP
nr:granulocyte-macrophage colony-stimulating factor receptor subunit alpha isoform X2 [Manis javanica]